MARRNVTIQTKQRLIIAANVRALVDHRFPGQRSRAIVLAKFLGCSVSQAQRLLSGSHGFTLETIGLIADKFRLEVWQLHVPGLDPKRPPRLTARKGASERATTAPRRTSPSSRAARGS